MSSFFHGTFVSQVLFSVAMDKKKRILWSVKGGGCILNSWIYFSVLSDKDTLTCLKNWEYLVSNNFNEVAPVPLTSSYTHLLLEYIDFPLPPPPPPVVLLLSNTQHSLKTDVSSSSKKEEL